MDPRDLRRAKRKALARLRETRSLADLKARCRNAPPTRDLLQAVRPGPEIRWLGSIQRKTRTGASLALPDSLDALVRSVEECEPAAWIVATDELAMEGRSTDLPGVRAASMLPLVRFDFIVDEYQIYESRVLGADGVVLIPALLEGTQLADYTAMAREELNLTPLIEVSRPADIEAALAIRPRILLLNVRTGAAGEDWIGSLESLLPMIPPHTLSIASETFDNAAHSTTLRERSIHAATLSPSLLTESDPALAIRRVMGTAGRPPKLIIVRNKPSELI